MDVDLFIANMIWLLMAKYSSTMKWHQKSSNLILCQSIVMLSARKFWELSPWPMVSPHRHFQCGGWPALVIFILIARCLQTSGTTIRELWNKQDLLLTVPGGYTACLGPYNKVMGKERKERMDLEVLPLMGSRVRCLGFCDFTICWWMQNIRVGIKVEGRKISHQKGRLSGSTRNF